MKRRRALPHPMRQQQGVLTHQAADAILGHRDVVQDAQTCPDLAMTFSDERRSLQVGTNGAQQAGVRHLRLGSATFRMQGYDIDFPGLLGGERRARKFQHLADQLQSIHAACSRLGRGSSRRPLADQRAFRLAFLAQDLVLHNQFANAPVGVI